MPKHAPRSPPRAPDLAIPRASDGRARAPATAASRAGHSPLRPLLRERRTRRPAPYLRARARGCGDSRWRRVHCCSSAASGPRPLRGCAADAGSRRPHPRRRADPTPSPTPHPTPRRRRSPRPSPRRGRHRPGSRASTSATGTAIPTSANSATRACASSSRRPPRAPRSSTTPTSGNTPCSAQTRTCVVGAYHFFDYSKGGVAPGQALPRHASPTTGLGGLLPLVVDVETLESLGTPNKAKAKGAAARHARRALSADRPLPHDLHQPSTCGRRSSVRRPASASTRSGWPAGDATRSTCPTAGATGCSGRSGSSSSAAARSWTATSTPPTMGKLTARAAALR